MAEALSAVCSVAANRTPKPILQCVRVEAHADFILLTCTDLELGIRIAINQVEVAQPGETLVPAEKLSSIVRESADDVLNFDMVGNNLNIRGSDAHFQVVTQDVADFPPVPTIEGEPSFTAPYGALRRLIEWTSFAAARESSRYAINGVLWEVQGTKLTMAATDGRRLSCGHTEVSGVQGDAVLQSIIPSKALTLLNRLSSDADTPMLVKLTDNQAIFRIGPATISTSLVEGRFPKYQEVIPTDSKHTVTLNTLEFQSALKRASLLTNEESKGVRLAFASGMLTITSRAPEQGEAKISMPLDYRGEALEIGFNPVFLLDVLRVAHTDTISFSFKESNRPGIVRADEQLLYVVMPVSL